MIFNVGALDRQFTLQRPSGLDADDYEDVETDLWGHKRFASGQEALRGATPAAQATHVVTIRYREDLRANWRLVESDTSPAGVLQISVFGDPEGNREMLQVFCVELQ